MKPTLLRSIVCTILLIVAIWGFFRPQRSPVELLVLVPASLTDAINECRESYEAAHPTIRVVTSVASSGYLQRQIQQGAAADVFISASTPLAWQLVEEELVDAKNVWPLATNSLVLVQHKDGTPVLAPDVSWHGLVEPDVQRVALGNPEFVPAGQYGREVLETLALWQALQGKLVLAQNVRQVLQYVVSGNVDAGVVYKTDALTANVTVVAEAPPGSHSPIEYAIALPNSSRHPNEARRFIQFLRSDLSQSVLREFGFNPTP